MILFTFTDNRPLRKFTFTYTAAELAAHLSKDVQFMFYWRKGWDTRLAAIRSLNFSPPDVRAAVCPHITEEQWSVIDVELHKLSASH